MERDLVGLLILFGYYAVVFVLIPTPLKYYTRIPAELIRKGQHIGYSMSVFLLLHLFSTWYAAVAASAALVVIAYPLLILFEKTGWYAYAFADRAHGGGEYRRSLLTVQATFAVLIAVLWGGLGSRWAPVVGAAAAGWGFGDAAAALVGKAWGRRRVLLRWMDRTKTYEGSAAMVAVAGVAFFLTLLFYVGLPWYQSLVIAVIAAPLCSLAELVTRRGFDTVTVPLTAVLIIVPLMRLFARVGW